MCTKLLVVAALLTTEYSKQVSHMEDQLHFNVTHPQMDTVKNNKSIEDGQMDR